MAYIGRTPTASALTSSDITDGIITEAKMADDAISLTELKAGTDGELITWDASGNPAAVGAGSSGHFLKSQGAGSVPVFAAGGLDGVTTGSGNVTISDGNLIIGTAGHGIDFSAHGQAGGMTGELLDEYEEGTFTPATSGISYTYNTGYYKKIGNLVYIQAYVIVNTYSSGSRVNIGGLPFTSESHHGDSRYPLSVARWSGLHVSTISLNPFVTNNGTTIGMDGEAASATSCDTNIEVWTSSTQMTIAGCYMAG